MQSTWADPHWVLAFDIVMTDGGSPSAVRSICLSDKGENMGTYVADLSRLHSDVQLDRWFDHVLAVNAKCKARGMYLACITWDSREFSGDTGTKSLLNMLQFDRLNSRMEPRLYMRNLKGLLEGALMVLAPEHRGRPGYPMCAALNLDQHYPPHAQTVVKTMLSTRLSFVARTAALYLALIERTRAPPAYQAVVGPDQSLD